jgi:hypothetical protein
MKARIYPWLLAAAALTVYGGFFLFYYAVLDVTTTSKPFAGILPSMAWTSSAGFVFFLIAVWSFAAVCGLVIAIVATLFFGHMSAIEEYPVEQPLVMKQAA